jgi:membrane protein YdbS with pleckstrin-like domain
MSHDKQFNQQERVQRIRNAIIILALTSIAGPFVYWHRIHLLGRNGVVLFIVFYVVFCAGLLSFLLWKYHRLKKRP